MKSNWVFSLKRAKTRRYHEWAKENYFKLRNRQEEAGREEGETSFCGARYLSHCAPKGTAVFAQRGPKSTKKFHHRPLQIHGFTLKEL